MLLKTVFNVTVYCTLVIAAFLGNILVFLAVKKNRHMHTTTNFLLANLAAAGLWTAIWSVPFVVFKSLSHQRGKVGDFLCKFVSMNNMSGLSILVSVCTMTLLAVERYHALLKPMNTQLRLKKGSVWQAVAGFWLFAALLNMPTILYAEYDEDKEQCVYIWNKTTYAVIIVFFTALAACTITFCYCKIIKELYFSKTICREGVEQDLESKRKIVKLLLIQVIGFFVCYFPFVVVEFIIPWHLPVAHYLCTYLLYCSSVINPIIYAFRSSNYRKAYKEIALEFKLWICCCSRKKTRWQDNSSTSERECFETTTF